MVIPGQAPMIARLRTLFSAMKDGPLVLYSSCHFTGRCGGVDSATRSLKFV
jgi:hypothetical protein